MAKVSGPITLSAGTGSKSFSLGVSGITRLNIKSNLPGVSYVSSCEGDWLAGNQYYRSEVDNLGSYPVGTSFDLVNSAGVVVYRASLTGIVGAVATWNVIINSITGTQPTLMLNGDDYA